jgi:hypothetical protein
VGFVPLFRTLDNGPNPGLIVESFGSIGLPLSDRDAEALIKQTRQSLSGAIWHVICQSLPI